MSTGGTRDRPQVPFPLSRAAVDIVNSAHDRGRGSHVDLVATLGTVRHAISVLVDRALHGMLWHSCFHQRAIRQGAEMTAPIRLENPRWTLNSNGVWSLECDDLCSATVDENCWFTWSSDWSVERQGDTTTIPDAMRAAVAAIREAGVFEFASEPESPEGVE